MARSIDWQRYHLLQDLIAEAIGIAVDADGDDYFETYTFAVNPDLCEVVCWNESCGLSEMEFFDKYTRLGYTLESATSLEDAVACADYYFDLR